VESNEPLAPIPASSGNERIFAIISLVIGILNLCAWLLPVCGIPLGVAGAVLGYLGMKAPEQKNLAIAGIALSGLGILLACINAIASVVFAPEIQRMINRMF
jgi:NO-binding membrane sensor protein with MHYT domain